MAEETGGPHFSGRTTQGQRVQDSVDHSGCNQVKAPQEMENY